MERVPASAVPNVRYTLEAQILALRAGRAGPPPTDDEAWTRLALATTSLSCVRLAYLNARVSELSVGLGA